MKKFFTSLLLIFCTVFILPQSHRESNVYLNSLHNKINKILSDSFFTSSQIAIDVVDLKTKKTLYQKNEKVLYRPASNLKILTSAAGLLFLGPDYEFSTRLYHTGQIKNSTLFGDLYIVGGFDPIFSVDDLDTLLIGLEQTGIKKITGNIYADVSAKDSLFWGSGWMWDDDPSSDAPYLSALNINENVVKVIYSPTQVGFPVKVKLIPKSNYYSFNNYAVTSISDSPKVKLNRGWLDRKNNITLSGNLSYSADADTDEINVFDPVKYFLSLFRQKLFENHITFTGIEDTLTLPASANLIGMYKHKYGDIINPLNKESDNLDAEMTLYALADKYYGKPATAENGIKMIDSLITLAGFDPADYRIVDGSGVSHYNLISAEIILGVLKYLYYGSPDLFKLFYDSLPIAGDDGTLDNRMKDTPAQDKLRAKTGTISGVSCLSGYIKARNGHDIAFSIMVQNYVAKAKVARVFIDEICDLLARYK
jgi:D-alanyl-D-alanine carboxypeptidase/D-alanyl-D-alanine-endopeptidase (penicillin-binding protein 4)